MKLRRNMDERDEHILNSFGWNVECYSPFEIRKDESFATNEAAEIVTYYCKIEYKDSIECFWEAVQKCLEKFHNMQGNKADELKQKIDELDSVEEQTLFYHNEPWDIACTIAKNNIPVTKHLDAYMEIRDA